MFLVEKGFANNEISASKGKVIEIKDKSLASALLEAGYISPYSEKEISNKEAKETIKKLEKELASKDSEIATLNDMISELEEKLNAKDGEESTENVDEPPTENTDDNLDDNEPSTDGENDNGDNEPPKEDKE